MSSPRYATPLRIRLEHSPRLRWLYLLFFTLSLTALLIAQLAFVPKLAALLMMVAAFVTTWRRRPELGGAEAALTLRPNGSWLLERDGGQLALRLDGQSTVSQSLLLLCFRQQEGGGRFDCLLWRHELPAQLFRSLQVYLKLYAQEAI